jgi:cellulose biosynthesis protein BcsQ
MCLSTAPRLWACLTVNGLVAADSVLVPIQCEYYALEGLGQLLSTSQAGTGRLKSRGWR